MFRIAKKLLFILLMGIGSAYALICPTAQEFNTHLTTSPYDYIPRKNIVIFSSISVAGNMLNQDNGWFLFIKSHQSTPEDNHQVLVSNTVSQLRNVNKDAYEDKINASDLNVPYCIYTLPNNPNFSAIAYYIDVSDSDTELENMLPTTANKKPIKLLFQKLALA